MLPVLPRIRNASAGDDNGKVRDFYTLAKRENNALESQFHMQARIGFRRSRAPGVVKLRPLSVDDIAERPRRRKKFNKHGMLVEAEPSDRLLLPPLEMEPGLSSSASACVVASPSLPAPHGGALVMDIGKPTASPSRGPPHRPAPDSSQECDVAALRKQAGNILMQADEDGTLSAALNELKGEMSQGGSDGGDVNLESLRKHACGVLFKATEDGSLGEALDRLKSKEPEPAPSKVKLPDTPAVTVNLALDLAREISICAVEDAISSAREDLIDGAGDSPRSVVDLQD